MKTPGLLLLVLLGISTRILAEEARFLRLVGPAPTVILGVTADGYVTWTNAQADTICTVQTTCSLIASNWVDYIQVPVSNHVITRRLWDFNSPTGMVFIPAGSFTMGSTNDISESPLHTVYVSAFYMEKYEVTKQSWDEIHQWATNHGYSFEYGAGGKATNHPVHSVTWYDAVKWCNARSEKDGRTPAYYTSVERTNVYRSGQVDVQNEWVLWNAGYRLPTEAEWEKAARGGASGRRFPWSDTDDITHSRANYTSSSLYTYDTSPTRGYHPSFATGGTPYTSPVGYFSANAYGLHDIAGNQWEWCWDWYRYDYYASSPDSDPRGPTTVVTARVIRGGGWSGNASSCRTASRIYAGPDRRNEFIGFRCALVPSP